MFWSWLFFVFGPTKCRNVRYVANTFFSPMSMWLINPPERIRGTFSEELCNGLTSFLPQVTASGTHILILFWVCTFVNLQWTCDFHPTAMQNILKNRVLDWGHIDICLTAFVQLCQPPDLWYQAERGEEEKMVGLKYLVQWCLMEDRSQSRANSV